MRKLLRKIAAIITTAAIAVSAMVIPTTTASADSIYDTATSISSGKAVSTTLIDYGDCADYKVKVTGNGLLKLNVTTELSYVRVFVYDSNGNNVKLADKETTSGECKYDSDGYTGCSWNSTVEKFKGTVSYQVNKGDYYIRVKRYFCDGNGKISVTATFPSTTANAKISYLTLELTKGSSIKLGAVVSPSGSAVTWKSSKTSVATVSSTGRVTAKAKGTTIITAKSGTSTQKIKIIVT